MDLSFLFLIALPTALLFVLPFVGKLWSAVVSYVMFGIVFAYSATASVLLSVTPNGSDLSFAQLNLYVAVIALGMMVVTFFVYRVRSKKKATRV